MQGDVRLLLVTDNTFPLLGNDLGTEIPRL